VPLARGGGGGLSADMWSGWWPRNKETEEVVLDGVHTLLHHHDVVLISLDSLLLLTGCWSRCTGHRLNFSVRDELQRNSSLHASRGDL
jgi:hypothetical protein